MKFVPFSVRRDPSKQESYEALLPGVPVGLAGTLFNFVMTCIGGGYGDSRYVASEHRLRLSRVFGMHFPESRTEVAALVQDDPGMFLDLVDYCLRFGDTSAWGNPYQLAAAFLEARSVYTVATGSDGYWELMERQPQELTNLMGQTMSGSGEASARLAEAWARSFSRTPDLEAACHAAVQAIEAAARPVVLPNDDKATLGKMITAMRDKPDKWATPLPDKMGVVISMAESVWTGYGRHGGDPNPKPLSAENTQMLVHTAVLLVHWVPVRLRQVKPIILFISRRLGPSCSDHRGC